MSLNLRFSKRADLIAALEARRPWAEALDAKVLAEHQAAEREWWKENQRRCRAFLKLPFEEAKAVGFTPDFHRPPEPGQRYRNDSAPSCPRSVVERLDSHIRTLTASRQEWFTISPESNSFGGGWGSPFWLLTHDEDAAPGGLC